MQDTIKGQILTLGYYSNMYNKKECTLQALLDEINKAEALLDSFKVSTDLSMRLASLLDNMRVYKDIEANAHIKESDRLNAIVDTASDALHIVCAPHKIQMGLTSDECKASYEYKAAKSSYNKAFENLRTYNKTISNKVKRDASIIRRSSKMIQSLIKDQSKQ